MDEDAGMDVAVWKPRLRRRLKTLPTGAYGCRMATPPASRRPRAVPRAAAVGPNAAAAKAPHARAGNGRASARDLSCWGITPKDVSQLDDLVCPTIALMSLLGGKWSIPLLAQLDSAPAGAEAIRSADLLRAVPGITRKELSKRLRQFERLGLVTRQVHATVPPSVDYAITAEGRSLPPSLRSLSRWAEAHREEIRRLTTRW